MTVPPANADSVQCSVEHSERLPSGLTADWVCAAFRDAIAPALTDSHPTPQSVAVAVRVESETKIVARASLAGAALPEHRVAISDRVLNSGAIEMLARAIAAEVSSSGH